MPVRRIPRSYHNVTGRKAGALGSRAIAVESTLERDFVTLALFDPAVLSIEEQPLTIPLPPPARRYTPDFLVRYRDGTADLVEVKREQELNERAAELETKFVAARTYAHSRGWRFRVVTEREIRVPRLENARFLFPFRRRRINPGLLARLIIAAERAGIQRLGELLHRAFPDQGEHPHALPALWHLLATFRLAVDMDQVLSMDSSVALAEAAP